MNKHKKTYPLKIFFALSGAAIGVGVALASYDGTVNSVHFYQSPNWEDEEIDFGRPPIENRVFGWTNTDIRSNNYESHWFEIEREGSKKSYLRVRARNLEVAGKLSSALRAYQQSVQHQSERSFIQDRKEIYAALRSSKDKRGFNEYLRARYIAEYGDSEVALNLLQALWKQPTSDVLKPHIAYAIAAIKDYRVDGFAGGFEEVARGYPQSPRAEPALIMAARSLLAEKITSSRVLRAEKALNTLLNAYPNTRFKANAIGWLGRCEALTGRLDKAIRTYERQIHAANGNQAEIWQAYDSIAAIYAQRQWRAQQIEALLHQWAISDSNQQMACGLNLKAAFLRLNTGGTRALNKMFDAQPKLYYAYLTYRMDATRLTQQRESELLKQAVAKEKRWKGRADGNFQARVAELAYNADKAVTAYQYAVKAVQSKDITSTNLYRALYIQGSSLARFRRYTESIRAYEKLIASAPKSHFLTKGAREAVALLYERHGDPVHALAHYQALNYRYDVAYLADAVLTPSQLSRYTKTLKPSNWRNVLSFTLGMKYLREENFRAARAQFTKVPQSLLKFGGLKLAKGEQLDKMYDDKLEVPNPLSTVAALERFDKRIRQVKSDDDRAQALYNKAAFIYKNRDLLFYSPGLWRGQRAYLLSNHWNPYINKQTDEKNVKTYSYEHECLARSLKICERILREFPKATVLPKALYTAGLSAERLSNINYWWRREDNRSKLRKRAIAYLERLAKHYPKDPLTAPAKKYAKVFREMETNTF